jgi:hypothetical protein
MGSAFGGKAGGGVTKGVKVAARRKAWKGSAILTMGGSLLLGVSASHAMAFLKEKPIAAWDWKMGYGYQYTLPARPTNFQILDFLPSARVPMTDSAGPGLLHGQLIWNPELHLGLFIHPYERPLVGITPIQLQWQLDSFGRFKPYLLGGMGVLYSNINRRETRNDLNFNLQVGLGFYYSFNDNLSLIAEYRHAHVSNAGLHEDNAGLNTHHFLAGVSIKK